MSGIMSPGHPSATRRQEMRDLVSAQKPLGVSCLRKGDKSKDREDGGQARGGKRV